VSVTVSYQAELRLIFVSGDLPDFAKLSALLSNYVNQSGVSETVANELVALFSKNKLKISLKVSTGYVLGLLEEVAQHYPAMQLLCGLQGDDADGGLEEGSYLFLENGFCTLLQEPKPSQLEENNLGIKLDGERTSCFIRVMIVQGTIPNEAQFLFRSVLSRMLELTQGDSESSMREFWAAFVNGTSFVSLSSAEAILALNVIAAEYQQLKFLAEIVADPSSSKVHKIEPYFASDLASNAKPGFLDFLKSKN
jgi:hypothetical protein